MADDWFYSQRNEKHGPVSFAKLKTMASDGWLTPDDLVWRRGMPNWISAKDADGLFTNSLARLLKRTITGLAPKADAPATTRTSEPAQPDGTDEVAPQPAIPGRPVKPASKKPEPKEPAFQWEQLSARHMIAAGGGFLAALGIAFTAIAQSPLGLAFTLSGLFVAAIGLYVEIGRLLGQALENIGRASKEAADRRLRAKELALEKQRLDLEAAKLAEQRAARERPAVASAPAQALAPTVAAAQDSQGQLVVINQPPVRLWSPGLAAVLSFFMPGLGQLYKGQFFNAVAWFCMVMLGYAALILPGLILHFFCVLGALSGNPWTECKTTVVRQ